MDWCQGQQGMVNMKAAVLGWRQEIRAAGERERVPVEVIDELELLLAGHESRYGSAALNALINRSVASEVTDKASASGASCALNLLELMFSATLALAQVVRLRAQGHLSDTLECAMAYVAAELLQSSRPGIREAAFGRLRAVVNTGGEPGLT